MRPTKTELTALADAQNAQWPQYKGVFDGGLWFRCEVRRQIRTKMGVAFDKGEITIAKPCEFDAGRLVTAYSFKNRIQTSIPNGAVRVLAAYDGGPVPGTHP